MSSLLRFVVLTIVPALFACIVRVSPVDAEGDSPQQNRAPDVVGIIEARCTHCHGLTLVINFSHRMIENSGKSAFEAFLTTHRAPDAEARTAIVDFLAETAAQTR